MQVGALNYGGYMEAINYEDAMYPIRTDFAAAHNRYWARLGQPGAWWTSAERIDIAKEIRAVWDCSLCAERRDALSPNAVRGEHTAVTSLPPLAIDAIHRIVTDASRLSRTWYQSLIEGGLSEGQYIEIVGTVVAMVSIDSFATAIGVSERELPTPRNGEITRYRPASAGSDDAWVPMVSVDNAGTAEEDLWVSGRTGNVIRAMSLVPDEVRTLKDLSAAHYLAMADVPKTGVDRGGPLNRSQIELVAGRTSALNACYY
jgi:hypothetical protein